MPWWFHVAESKHDIQNPTSREKILLLGERLGLSGGSHVLDMGAGRGGPAVLLAQTYGCRITCVEKSDEFAAAARDRVRSVGVEELVEVIQIPGEEFDVGVDRYDCALCFGASFIYGGVPQTVATLSPSVRDGGFVAVGEPYWTGAGRPDGVDLDDWDFLPLEQTVARFEEAGVALVTMILSSQDDWDRYETLRWLAVEDWVHKNPDDPEAETFRQTSREDRDAYLSWQRDLLGWGIFVGRKRSFPKPPNRPAD